MDPLSELQDDLTLDDPSQALNQLKLASIDEKNWPSDEMPDFPKSGGRGLMSAALGALEGETPCTSCGRKTLGGRGGDKQISPHQSRPDQMRVGLGHRP